MQYHTRINSRNACVVVRDRIARRNRLRRKLHCAQADQRYSVDGFTPQPSRNLVATIELSGMTNAIEGRRMLPYWKLWLDVLRLGFDAQNLAKRSPQEAQGLKGCLRMISVKLAAAAAAGDVALRALGSHKGIDAAARIALTPVRRTVRANLWRLSWGRRFETTVSRVRPLTGSLRFPIKR
jgi:hypothetical protein